MACIVQKYGGSSLADIEKLKKVANIIATVKKQNTDVAVIVSAMGKTTDNMVKMARDLSPDPPSVVMSLLQLTPWKPPTTTTLPFAISSCTRKGRTSITRASL